MIEGRVEEISYLNQMGGGGGQWNIYKPITATKEQILNLKQLFIWQVFFAT